MDTLPTDRPPDIRVLAMPADTNAAGDIFGGWLMSQVDIAGSILAFRIADGRVATVAVNNFTFLKPVFVGDLVSLYTRLVKIGNTSVQIAVEAFAQRHRGIEESHKVATATLTYVAVGEDRRPRPIPKQ
ncbi:MAG: acyl-CoA thioesterase [Gammaproteobacteria bacterium]|nr:acyl-CoA thioesterase [Gammaproteobacteria bacterium]